MKVDDLVKVDNIMKTVILMLILVLTSCSYSTITTRDNNPRECTTHYTAPIADTLLIIPGILMLAVLPVAIALSSMGSRSQREIAMIAIPAAGSSIVFGFSAVHGYRKVAECRNDKFRSKAIRYDIYGKRRLP